MQFIDSSKTRTGQENDKNVANQSKLTNNQYGYLVHDNTSEASSSRHDFDTFSLGSKAIFANFLEANMGAKSTEQPTIDQGTDRVMSAYERIKQKHGKPSEQK